VQLLTDFAAAATVTERASLSDEAEPLLDTNLLHTQVFRFVCPLVLQLSLYVLTSSARSIVICIRMYSFYSMANGACCHVVQQSMC
jgi:hypothetical protein